MLALVFAAGLAGGASHYRLLSREQTGLPAVLPAVIPGGFEQGRLVVHEPQPHIPNNIFLTRLMALVSYQDIGAMAVPDSFLVIDTRQSSRVPIGGQTAIVLGADSMHIAFGAKPMSISYQLLGMRDASAELNAQTVRRAMTGNWLNIVSGLVVSHMASNAGNLLMAMLFIGFAAFIFKRGTVRRVRDSLKIAAYAITPFPLISIAGAAAGVRAQWLWHLSLFFSLILVFRGVLKKPKSKTTNTPSGGDT
jgi:hypothetical protein